MIQFKAGFVWSEDKDDLEKHIHILPPENKKCDRNNANKSQQSEHGRRRETIDFFLIPQRLYWTTKSTTRTALITSNTTTTDVVRNESNNDHNSFLTQCVLFIHSCPLVAGLCNYDCSGNVVNGVKVMKHKRNVLKL